MKKLVVSMGLVASIFAFTGISQAQAQAIDISQFRQVIELFIALGIISSDKVDQVRLAFGISTTTPIQTIATSTPVTPIFGISTSNASSTQPSQLITQPVNNQSMTLAFATQSRGSYNQNRHKYEDSLTAPYHLVRVNIGDAKKATVSFVGNDTKIEFVSPKVDDNVIVMNSSDIGTSFTITSYDKDGNVLGTTTGIIE